MTQQTEIEKIKEKQADNQNLFVQMLLKRADQERELDDLLRTYQVEEDELTLWVNALCGKYGMKIKK